MILIKNESDFFILGSFEFWSYCICSENLQNSRSNLFCFNILASFQSARHRW